MRYLNEYRPRSGTIEDFGGRGHGCGNLFRIGDACRETRQWSKDIQLSWRLMQRVAGLVQQRRGNVGPNQQNRRIRLQALQKWNEGEKIARACRREHSSNVP